ncbi:hypothetical protein D1AOALGA4SA_4232 [Olavius algarvensis Delta 1 endosymbiont]|nr:hypothetical protein D1AOALGA4SA_4232 [Olavius algarvensis Delta 1 endosymbiont]
MGSVPEPAVCGRNTRIPGFKNEIHKYLKLFNKNQKSCYLKNYLA